MLADAIGVDPLQVGPVLDALVELLDREQ